MKTLRPVEDAEAARAFYAEAAPALDLGHLAAMWHLVGLGHLVSTDLDRIAGEHGLSSADLYLLGTLRVIGPLRATDLALKLHLSQAVLSGRVVKLEELGLLVRERIVSDKRAFKLRVTAQGAAQADAVVAETSRKGRFALAHAALSDDDRAALARVLGHLHEAVARHF